MALPFLGSKKKKKVGRPKKDTKKTLSDKGSRLGKLAKATVDYTVVRPSKFFAQQTVAGLAKEMPETTILTNLIGDMLSDISHIFSKQKKNDKSDTEKSKEEKIAETVKTALETIATAFDNQTKILSQNLKDININLGTLDNIYGELRTLSSITAKVWDVSNKQLYDTRYRNKKLAIKEKEQRFLSTVEKQDNQTLEENLESVQPMNDNQKGERGILSKMGGGILDKIKEWLGMGAGISAGGGLLSIITGIGKTILKGIASLIFSKVGLATLIGGSILAIGKYIWDNKDQIMEYLGKVWDDAKDWAFEKISQGWEMLKETGSKFVDWLTNSIMSIPKLISKTFTNILDSFKKGIINLSKMIPKSWQKKLGIENIETVNNSTFVQTSNDNETHTLNNFEAGKDNSWLARKERSESKLNNIQRGDVGDVTEVFQKIKEQENQEKRLSNSQGELTFNEILNGVKSSQPVVIQNNNSMPTTNTSNNSTSINVNNGMGYREKQIRNYYNIDKY